MSPISHAPQFIAAPRGAPSTPMSPRATDTIAGVVRDVPRTRVAAASLPEVLRPFAADPSVTDLFVNGERGLFVDRGHGAEPQPGWRASESDVRALAVELIGLGGRHIDDGAPCVDVRLEGGIRVHAVLAPVSADGTAISIRIPSASVSILADLERLGACSAQGRAVLEQIVAERHNILITGAGGSGKTSLLAAMLASAERRERIVTIEDVAELAIDHPHHVRLEAKQPNLEGAGAISLATLVREALRMRPDRLVVGECRGEEVRELLSALNTGHDGGAGTLHANSLDDVPARLEALGALAGLDDNALARQAVSAIGRVIHLERTGGSRRIAALGRPVIDAGRLTIVSLPWPG